MRSSPGSCSRRWSRRRSRQVLQATANLAAERAALDRHWQQRRERARYLAERARRQYDAIEPENRLAVRTLERDWEQALTEQARLEADYERFRREQPPAPGPNEIAALQSLAQDLPSVWHATTTTQEERQTLVRLMLERILVSVIDGSEQVRVECHWHGGNHTTHHMTRPVARLTALSTYRDLVARMTELFRAGHGSAEIADVLNREGWRPAKRRDTFTVQMVRHLLVKAGVAAPKYSRRKPTIERQSDEWTIKDLAHHLAMPESTLYAWVQQGRLRSRQVSVDGFTVKLLHADAATIARLQAFARRLNPGAACRRAPPIIPPQSLESRHAWSISTLQRFAYLVSRVFAFASLRLVQRHQGAFMSLACTQTTALRWTRNVRQPRGLIKVEPGESPTVMCLSRRQDKV